MSLQTIGSYLDALLFLAFGLIAIVAPQRLVGGGTDDETKKKVKWMRIGGYILVFCAVASVAIKLLK